MWARSHDSAVRADSCVTFPWRPVRVSAPAPGIRGRLDEDHGAAARRLALPDGDARLRGAPGDLGAGWRPRPEHRGEHRRRDFDRPRVPASAAAHHLGAHCAERRAASRPPPRACSRGSAPRPWVRPGRRSARAVPSGAAAGARSESSASPPRCTRAFHREQAARQ